MTRARERTCVRFDFPHLDLPHIPMRPRQRSAARCGEFAEVRARSLRQAQGTLWDKSTLTQLELLNFAASESGPGLLPAELDRAPAERNLILVHRKGFWDIADFFAIRDVIAARAPDIEVFIVDNHAPHSVTRRQAARRPTLVFSPTPLLEFKPARGRIYWAAYAEDRGNPPAKGRRPASPGYSHARAGHPPRPRDWGPLTVSEAEPRDHERGCHGAADTSGPLDGSVRLARR